MQRYREAALVLEQGLDIDPFHAGIKAHLEKATQGIFKDLLDGAASASSPALGSQLPARTLLITLGLCSCARQLL